MPMEFLYIQQALFFVDIPDSVFSSREHASMLNNKHRGEALDRIFTWDEFWCGRSSCRSVTIIVSGIKVLSAISLKTMQKFGFQPLWS